MQFYQFQYKERMPHHAADFTQAPVKTEWFGSEREAVKRRLALWNAGKLLGRKSDNEIWPVDVPTRKEDLLAWLNRECV